MRSLRRDSIRLSFSFMKLPRSGRTPARRIAFPVGIVYSETAEYPFVLPLGIVFSPDLRRNAAAGLRAAGYNLF